jgi:hypothetical protein
MGITRIQVDTERHQQDHRIKISLARASVRMENMEDLIELESKIWENSSLPVTAHVHIVRITERPHTLTPTRPTQIGNLENDIIEDNICCRI